MTKRSNKPRPSKARNPPEPKPSWAPERHSGEGSASALATLQTLEKRRRATRPDEPHDREEPDS